ncbi:MAG: hypothetical protein JNM64_03980 [Chloroflexia bacterium]|nr:hypothetical protein [Chloroflexia bacterium]
MQRFFRDNGLSLVLLALFLLFWGAQSYTGWQVENEDREEHEQPALTYPAYLQSGHFIEATFENWESEYLQMGAYVLLTVFLFQRGSSESKDPDNPDEGAPDPEAERQRPDAPWPVRQGGLVLKLYENSLSLALLLLFAVTFVMHAIGGTWVSNEEKVLHGEAPQTVWDFMHSIDFWFQSFQNWQSEFLAVLSLVVLSIFLRQRGSPESKEVAAPHQETGS